jgi:hypothetical protein
MVPPRYEFVQSRCQWDELSLQNLQEKHSPKIKIFALELKTNRYYGIISSYGSNFKRL